MSDPTITTSVTVVSRPKRIAFIVPHDVELGPLNEIMMHATGSWGGCYYPIIPLQQDGQQVDADWWELLTSVDCDILYSLTSIPESLERQLATYILPGRIIYDFGLTGGATRTINPFNTACIGIHDMPQYLWHNRHSLQQPAFVYLTDGGDDLQRSLVLRNFGALSKTVANDAAYRDVPYREINAADSMTQLLVALNQDGRQAVLPGDLSSTEVLPVVDCPETSLCVVAGDTAMEAIYAWNRRVSVQRYLGRAVFSFSSAMLNDVATVDAAAEWLSQTYWRAENHHGAKIVSYSQTQAALEPLKAALIHRLGMPFSIELPDSPGGIRPPYVSVRRPSFNDTRIERTVITSFVRHEGLVEIPRPPFLRQDERQMGWSIALSIQVSQGTDTISGGSWILPRRIGLANAFLPASAHPRIDRECLPSGEVLGENRVLQIRYPTEFAIIRSLIQRPYGLSVGVLWPTPQNRSIAATDSAYFRKVQLSSEGAALDGLVRLFGGLHASEMYLREGFWRQVLLEMAGREGQAKEVADVANKVHAILLQAHAAGRLTTHPDDSGLLSTASDVSLLLRPGQRVAKYMTVENLTAILNRMENQRTSDPAQRRRFPDFKDDLLNLLDKDIFLQGIEKKCSDCGLTQWHRVEDLRSHLTCPGCGASQLLGIDTNWMFGLNRLLLHAVQAGGSLATIRTLYRLSHTTRNLFLFVPCLDVYRVGERDRFTDLDIVAVRDSFFIIGEVKSSPAGFRDEDFAKIREVALDLRPSIVLFSAVGDSWPHLVQGKVQQLQTELQPLGMAVEQILLDPP
ncbi:MAG: hypothetical protein ACYCOU_06845 [Sulfobacillus sp.]